MNLNSMGTEPWLLKVAAEFISGGAPLAERRKGEFRKETDSFLAAEPKQARGPGRDFGAVPISRVDDPGSLENGCFLMRWLHRCHGPENPPCMPTERPQRSGGLVQFRRVRKQVLRSCRDVRAYRLFPIGSPDREPLPCRAFSGGRNLAVELRARSPFQGTDDRTGQFAPFPETHRNSSILHSGFSCVHLARRAKRVHTIVNAARMSARATAHPEFPRPMNDDVSAFRHTSADPIRAGWWALDGAFGP
jgi:hypothetical protein